MTVSKRLRYEILRRDNHACRYCGDAAPDVRLTVDHVVPTALGGSDDPDNLVTACVDCNAGKSASPPDAPLVDRVREDMLRWRDAIRHASELVAAEREVRDTHRRSFLAHWSDWTYEYKGEQKTVPLPDDWPDAIDRFVAAGLETGDLVEAIEQTMRKRYIRDEFRYFCGVCWTMVSHRQELAAAYLREATDGA